MHAMRDPAWFMNRMRALDSFLSVGLGRGTSDAHGQRCKHVQHNVTNDLINGVNADLQLLQTRRARL